MNYKLCDYPTMREIYKIKEDIFESQKGMTLRERFEDTHSRGEEALIRLGLAETSERFGQ